MDGMNASSAWNTVPDDVRQHGDSLTGQQQNYQLSRAFGTRISGRNHMPSVRLQAARAQKALPRMLDLDTTQEI